jgi:predicted hotdog family 3-hydroxylacyl-ACP dehydratase
LFCQQQGVGAWIGVEYMAQAIAAHAGYMARLNGSQVKIGFLLGTRRYDCPRPYFTIGSLLQVHIRRILQAENGFGAFECRIDDMTIAANAAMAAVATITVFQPDNADEFLQDISI